MKKIHPQHFFNTHRRATTLAFEIPPANVHDVEIAEKLIREDDVVYGDSGYLGLQKRHEIRDNKNKAKIDFRINRRPSQVKTSDTYARRQHLLFGFTKSATIDQINLIQTCEYQIIVIVFLRCSE